MDRLSDCPSPATSYYDPPDDDPDGIEWERKIAEAEDEHADDCDRDDQFVGYE